MIIIQPLAGTKGGTFDKFSADTRASSAASAASSSCSNSSPSSSSDESALPTDDAIAEPVLCLSAPLRTSRTSVCGRTARRARQRGAHQARARAQAPAALGPRPALHDRAGSALHKRGTRPLRPRPGARGARVDVRAGAQKGQMSATRTENGRIGLRSTLCVATTVSCSVRTCQMSVR